jgi:hypothetical protein
VEKPALARAKICGMAWLGSSCFGILNLEDFTAKFPWGTMRTSGDFTSSSRALKLVLVMKII